MPLETLGQRNISRFEGAAGAFRQLDLIFRARFFAVLLERKLDELVDEIAEGDSARFPELWIHADGGEAWDGIYFVEINLSAIFLEEEIHARHAAQFQRAKRIHGELLKFFYLRRFQLCRNQELRTFFQIFCRV